MKAENIGKRVRGCVVVANRWACPVSKDNPDCIVAYTHWYRHDDDLALLDHELDQLAKLYMGFRKTSSAMISYEYADYTK